MSATLGLATAARPRSFVRVAGRDAESHLQRMVSNDVAALEPSQSCEALLLTPKARVIAPLRVLRRGADDFLLLTEPELGERVLQELIRSRFAAKVEIELEQHESVLLLGADLPAPNGSAAIPNSDYGVPGVEVVDGERPADARELSADELELLRIRAATPRFGREIDDRVLPAEAGLVERAVSFDKGCYPGQEPIARLRYRGHVNRGLRVLEIEADQPPSYDTPVVLDEKQVGRITSAATSGERRYTLLGYVRTDVPDEAELRVGAAKASTYAVTPSA